MNKIIIIIIIIIIIVFYVIVSHKNSNEMYISGDIRNSYWQHCMHLL